MSLASLPVNLDGLLVAKDVDRVGDYFGFYAADNTEEIVIIKDAEISGVARLLCDRRQI